MVADKPKKNVQILNLVKLTKVNRVNRVYYTKPGSAKDFFQSGAIQSEEKSKLDLFSLNESQNDSIFLYAISPEGSHFELDLSIVSLYDDIQQANKENRWRLGRVNFMYYDIKSKAKYSYKHEELIDFNLRRQNAHTDKHANQNTIKIGCLTLEIVLPFSFNRILFQGLFVKEYENGLHQLIPGRLAISTHPTSDKFDYQYRFNTNYVANAIEQTLNKENPSADQIKDSKDLLKAMLENRIDQPLMFHAHFDIPGLDYSKSIMWGGKIKKILSATGIESLEDNCNTNNHEPRESLLIWSECGHLIHLNRPVNFPNLMTGMIHNTFEYVSHLYSACWDLGGGEDCPFERDIGQLPSFDQLKAGTKIKLIGFKTKENIIEIIDDVAHDNTIKENGGLFRIRINGFDGWAMFRRSDIGSLYRQAQSKLLALNINDLKCCVKLASDHLLGGKGFSLVELSQLVRMVDNKVPSVVQSCEASNMSNICTEVNVPRGIIVTSLSYKLWLNSDTRISIALARLDAVRRQLSARSYFVDPFCERHITINEQQKLLTEECNRCVGVLESCPLPELVASQLRSQLENVFGDGDSLNQKVFAVRSSALGEDSLETSAAGQMKTILDAKGFETICKSVVSCWASQFLLPATTYKTQNGLTFNWPMAVVVQELIECHSAGVGATCEPLMGNPRQLEITACLGMGEGVVAGRATDTIRLDLTNLAWDFERETVGNLITLANLEQCIELEPADNQRSKRYLTDQLLVSLGNLLLWIRNNRTNDNLKDREVEWGMTLEKPDNNMSSFRIHLFQSRPLTNLQRLSTREIDFELDTGLSGPNELITRANIGEVMPGTISPLTSSILTQQSSAIFGNDYNDKNFTMKFNANGSFSFAARITGLNLTDPALVHQLGGGTNKADRQAFAVMAGIEPEVADKLMKLIKEKINPSYEYSGVRSKTHYILNDIGILGVKMEKLKRQCAQVMANLKRTVPTTIEQWLDQIGDTLHKYDNEPDYAMTDKLSEIQKQIGVDIEKLFKVITTYEHPFFKIWHTFHEASQSSIHFNRMCIEHMSSQPYYLKPENAEKVLIDFSYLIQGSTKTESGDISHLLEKLVDRLAEQSLLDKVAGMSAKDLYLLLTTNEQQPTSSSTNSTAKDNKDSITMLYKKFIADNGHRGFKEYDIAHNTWVDDPSQIIKSLQGRVKQRLSKQTSESSASNGDDATPTSSSQNGNCDNNGNKQADKETNEKRIEEILSRIESNRIWFKNYLITGAKRGIVRRELGKSLFVYSVHMIRIVYRQLSALLCLKGLLPSIELASYLNIEELNEIVQGHCLNGNKDNVDIGSRADVARVLFKARRRHQRTRVLDRIAPPKPTMKFIDFYDLIYEMTEDRISETPSALQLNDDGDESKAVQVRGLTSCGGLVTGRACVIGSLDEVDEIQQGDILITYSIDVSWTVYFYALSGIVTELGGLVSHGAVVAREYAIPTLCTAMGACSKFKTGQIVTLDANNSCCYLAEANPTGDDA